MSVFLILFFVFLTGLFLTYTLFLLTSRASDKKRALLKERLADAIRSYLAVPREERTDAALRLARYYDWKRTVQPVVQVFRQWKKQ